MSHIGRWFRAKKSLYRRRVYYEDVYGRKNPEEDREGVHILDTDSESEAEITSPKRRVRDKTRTTLSNDNNQAMESIGERKGINPTINEVITIEDDDDSDVDELFIADLQRHAAENDDNQHIIGNNDQDEVDADFLAEVKKYASEPSGTSDAPSDSILAQIDQRAQEFADQSPLRPKNPEPVDRVDIQTMENSSEAVLEQPAEESAIVLSDSVNARARDDTTVSGITRRPVERIPRAHSWDSSQGSYYAYPEVEAADVHTSAGQDQERDSKVIDQAPAELHYDVESQNHEVIELENYESHNKADVQKAQPVAKDQDPPNTQQSGGLNNGRERNGFSTPLEVTKILSPKKGKRFGLFSARLSADIEPIAKSVYTEPPQRLRNLVNKRRREHEQKQEPEKRTRYNLRPHGQPARNHNGGPILAKRYVEADELDADINIRVEEPRDGQRRTRSMTTHKEARKPIPRSKAARKTAWSAMGITPRDRPHGARLSRQIVQVAIPKIDRSDWELMAVRTQSTAVNGIQASLGGEDGVAPALANNGWKRISEARNKKQSWDARVEIPSSRKRVLDVVLID
ncbi:hypothetical protein M436DRAFT_63314 [Aureobasidium namibiae CBS 147.97]|uniref:Uncharacterized protein n=1 Tax=Aureobasidium namibiae CBS 147.97 TaxID=1043004 RepID=A0A074WW45_9PEZI